MEHIIKYDAFDHINEARSKYNTNQNKGLLDIAWNILTLGQGKRIIANLKNRFSFSSYLIKSNLISIKRLLSDTIVSYNNDYVKRKIELKSYMPEITTKIEKVIGDENNPLIENQEVYRKVKDLLIHYEIESRILGFDKITTDILNKTYATINDIKNTPENSRLTEYDLKRIIENLDVQVDKLESLKRTNMLPSYDLKNIALEVSKIMNFNDVEGNNTDKARLKTEWEKGKNSIFQAYKDSYKISVLDSWLSLSSHQVRSIDHDIEQMYKNLPAIMNTLNDTFKPDSVKNVDSAAQLEFDSIGYYLFKIKAKTNYYILFYYAGDLDDNTQVLVPIGTYKFKTKGDAETTMELYSDPDMRFDKLNERSHVFYYVPNLCSFIIQVNPHTTRGEIDQSAVVATHQFELVTHELDVISKQHMVDTAEYIKSTAKNYAKVIKSKILNALWRKEFMIQAEFSDEHIDRFMNKDKNEVEAKNVENTDLEFQPRWNFIKKLLLQSNNWNEHMSVEEAQQTIFNK